MLNNGVELESVYPLLRELNPLQEKLFKNHPGPKIVLSTDGWGDWHLWTTVPECDYTHEASWSATKRLSPADDTEIRNHLVTILQIWIDQDDLYSQPMAIQDVAKEMDISVKTLNRYIKAGAVSRIEMNRNIIRVLKSNLAK
jgi:hypothetical protein